MSIGEVHNALDRAARAHLYDPERRQPRMLALEEFLLHGIKYAFPAERGALTRGTPTAYAAPPLNAIIASDENPPVWDDPSGTVRGYKLTPLYDSAPKAAKLDSALYQMLALVDAIRDGRARERELAGNQLRKRLRALNAKA